MRVRDYGTPMYAQMFTLYEGDQPVYEVRRLPLSRKSEGGLFDDNICHIRLVNRTCYAPDCVGHLRDFLLRHKYHYRGISRVDICNDFIKFDLGDNPQSFIDAYMRNKIGKINQSRVSAHGRDEFRQRYWNSLKWGSETSAVSTKMYDKTLELSIDGHDKLWIRDAWRQQELAETQWVSFRDTQGNERHKPVAVAFGSSVPHIIPESDAKQVRVWRVEFSIKTEGRLFVNTETGNLLRIDLGQIDHPAKLLYLFHVLCHHYFHFKTFTNTADGKPQRKDRCPDKVLFKLSSDESNFHPYRITYDKSPSRTYRMVCRLLSDISNDMDYSPPERQAAATLYGRLMYEATRHEVADFKPSNKPVPDYLVSLFGDMADTIRKLIGG